MLVKRTKAYARIIWSYWSFWVKKFLTSQLDRLPKPRQNTWRIRCVQSSHKFFSCVSLYWWVNHSWKCWNQLDCIVYGVCNVNWFKGKLGESSAGWVYSRDTAAVSQLDSTRIYLRNRPYSAAYHKSNCHFVIFLALLQVDLDWNLCFCSFWTYRCSEMLLWNALLKLPASPFPITRKCS